MTSDWYVMNNETPFLYDREEWTYVARRLSRNQYEFGYLRHADDIVYVDYRANKREVA